MKYLSFLASILFISPSFASDTFNKHDALTSLIMTIDEQYVLTKHIPEIKSALNKLPSTDAFKNIQTEAEFAQVTKETLQTFDKHFSVALVPNTNNTTQTKHAAPKESWFQKLQRKNAGFNKLEILDGNVGYIDFWGFNDLNAQTEKTIDNAMQFVANSDALIIDLRQNGGGSAQTVQFISSYFLPAKTHLNSFYARKTEQTTEFWTMDRVKRIFPEDIPVYLLISNNTFSAAEEFAYNFKQLKRAIIIGEPSKGGANPWQWFNISPELRAAIPVSMAVNPITQTNWEGKGVIPDIIISSENAKKEAYIQALTLLSSTASNPHQRAEIKDALARQLPELGSNSTQK